jgi:hypothetical protein
MRTTVHIVVAGALPICSPLQDFGAEIAAGDLYLNRLFTAAIEACRRGP